MRGTVHLAMAALVVGSLINPAFAAKKKSKKAEPVAEAPAPPAPGEAAPPPAPEAAPPAPAEAPAPAPAEAAAPGGATRVDAAIQAELATRQVPDQESYRAGQHLSWHMCWHDGHTPERYHHEDWPNHDEHHYHGWHRRPPGSEEEARIRRVAEAEIALEKSTNTHVCFVEDGNCPLPRGTCKFGHRRHAHVYMNDENSPNHTHHFGVVWANEWERLHKGCLWWIHGDIETIGSTEVPSCDGHLVPPPRPVRWNDSNLSCPMPVTEFFRPPPERTVVVPFPLPREGDWRAHISPLMNKIVDQVDWLRAVRVGQANCPPDVYKHPEGD